MEEDIRLRHKLGWHDLPIEVELSILATAVTSDEVTQMVLPFVCQSWLAYVSSWQRPVPPSRSATDHKEVLERIANKMAQAGWVSLLKWWMCDLKYPADKAIFRYAAGGGQVETMKWLKENGFELVESLCLCSAAARGGHLEALKWLRENECLVSAATCTAAATGNHLEALKWLSEIGCQGNEETFRHAAGVGNIEMLKWLKETGCEWDHFAISEAALVGNIEVMKWLRENGCPFNESACTAAAHEGHLDALKWLREQGCPWGQTCVGAANGGQMEILRWAIANGSACDEALRALAKEDFDW